MDSLIDDYNYYDYNNDYDLINEEWMLNPEFNPIVTGGIFLEPNYDAEYENFMEEVNQIEMANQENQVPEQVINQPSFVTSDFAYIDGESQEEYLSRRALYYDNVQREYNLKACWLVPFMNK